MIIRTSLDVFCYNWSFWKNAVCWSINSTHRSNCKGFSNLRDIVAHKDHRIAGRTHYISKLNSGAVSGTMMSTACHPVSHCNCKLLVGVPSQWDFHILYVVLMSIVFEVWCTAEWLIRGLKVALRRSGCFDDDVLCSNWIRYYHDVRWNDLSLSCCPMQWTGVNSAGLLWFHFIAGDMSEGEERSEASSWQDHAPSTASLREQGTLSRSNRDTAYHSNQSDRHLRCRS